MLPKRERLPRKFYLEVLRRGAIVKTPHLLARIYRADNEPLTRMAVSVSKKIAKKASKRNVLRRQAYRALSASKKLFPKHVRMIIAYTAPSTYEKVSSEIDFILSRAQNVK